MTGPASIRVVPELRAVHIERHQLGTPAELLYFSANYDLTGTALRDGIRHVSLGAALRRLGGTAATTLEVCEPLWIREWPRHVALITTFKLAALIRRRRVTVCTYAMENNDIHRLVAGRRRLPRAAVTTASFIIGTAARLAIDCIVYASPAAHRAYTQLPFVNGIPFCVVLELPRPDNECSNPRPLSAVFVGALENRKGVRELMQAWQRVEGIVPEAVLTIIGPGPLHLEVQKWAAADPSRRRVLGALPHEQARAELRRASVLVAPSVPDGRWREQIGLPIKEALAAGLTVVTTSETGLAGWLAENGHEVIDIDGPTNLGARLAWALARALRSPLDRDTVRSALPSEDGRLTSDRWLHRPTQASNELAYQGLLSVPTPTPTAWQGADS